MRLNTKIQEKLKNIISARTALRKRIRGTVMLELKENVLDTDTYLYLRKK